MPEAICDTSPIQYLHQLRLLSLLETFYTRTTIPTAVAEELATGRRIGIDLPLLSDYHWLHIETPATLVSLPDRPDLGAGEREVIALAMRVPKAVVIMDERIGRRYAETIKLPITGTLGILLLAKARGLIPGVKTLLDRLDRLGFRLSARTRVAALRQAGE